MQHEITCNAGTDALKLGLLMGTEDDPREEEQQEVLTFHHLLIMEFCAGKYISTLPDVSCAQGDSHTPQKLYLHIWCGFLTHKEKTRR